MITSSIANGLRVVPSLCTGLRFFVTEDAAGCGICRSELSACHPSLTAKRCEASTNVFDLAGV